MKKVGIATFHFADNYGAVLQCYALQRVINEIDGICAEIIDYRPPAFRYEKIWITEKEKNLFIKKRELFESFLKKYCNLSTHKVSLIDGDGYNYCCAGSDQVWCMEPYFMEYFFPHVQKDVYKFSYAASMGISVMDIRKKERKLIDSLTSFQTISVREKEHAEYLEEISGKECRVVIDPTLLLEADDYMLVICRKKEEEGGPFLFFYWIKNDNELFRAIELANMLARLFHLRIIHSIYGADSRLFFQGGKCMYYEGVEDFLWYVRNADFVVTNSYHGTLFSIQFEVPFYSFIVRRMRSRFDTLAGYTDISGRVITGMKGLKELNKSVDFRRIKDEIRKFRNESMVFLRGIFGV